MQLRDPDIYALIQKIGEHFNTNISSRYIRPVLMNIQVDSENGINIAALTERYEQYRYQGYQLSDLYRQILALSWFCFRIRHTVLNDLKNQVFLKDAGARTGQDKVFRDMAIFNFPANLQVLVGLLVELYSKAQAEDKRFNEGRRLVKDTIPELKNLEHYLHE